MLRKWVGRGEMGVGWALQNLMGQRLEIRLEIYETRNHRDRNKYGGGLIEFFKKGIIAKTLIRS